MLCLTASSGKACWWYFLHDELLILIYSHTFLHCNVAFKLGRQSHAKTHLQLQEQDENKDPWPHNSPQLHLEGGMMQICHYCCTTHGLYGILAAAHWHEHFHPPNSVAFLVQVTGVGAYKFKDFMPPGLSRTLRGLTALLAKQRHHSFVLSAPEIDMQEAPVLQANSGQSVFRNMLMSTKMSHVATTVLNSGKTRMILFTP